MILLAGLLTALAATDPALVWEVRPGFRDFGRIVVAGDVVLTGNVTGTGGTWAFRASNGARLWHAPGVLVSGPVTDGRAAFSINVGSGLSAYDLQSGTLRWRAADADGVPSANLAVAGGRVYAPGERGGLRAYDASAGSLIWEHAYHPGADRGSCPTTPVLADGVVYFGGGEDDQRRQGVSLWALDAASGKALWRYAARPDPGLRVGRCVSAPAFSQGVVVVTSQHVIFGVDARSGEERWRQAVVRQTGGAKSLRVLSPPVTAGERVYAMAEDALIGWDLRDGQQTFEFKGTFPGPSRIRNIVAADGLLFFTANFEQPEARQNRQGFLYALDPATGAVRWKHRSNRDLRYVDQWPTVFFAVADNSIYYENNSLLAKLRQ